MVNNLSSLVARFIFQPIEESFYVFFARTLLRGEPAAQQTTASLQLAMTTLARLLKLVVVISLVILVFGSSYSHLALRIYGGGLLADGEGEGKPPKSIRLQHYGPSLPSPPLPSPPTGPMLMRLFSAYIPLLALNGITECFFFALMSQAEIDQSVNAVGVRWTESADSHPHILQVQPEAASLLCHLPSLCPPADPHHGQRWLRTGQLCQHGCQNLAQVGPLLVLC